MHKKEGGAKVAPPPCEIRQLELEPEEHAGVERRLSSARGTDGHTRDVRRLEEVGIGGSEAEVNVLVDIQYALGVGDVKQVNAESQMGLFSDVHHVVAVEVNGAGRR